MMFYKLLFSNRGLDLVYKWNSVEFSGVRIFRDYVLRLGFRFSFFKRAMISECLTDFWLGFKKLGLI